MTVSGRMGSGGRALCRQWCSLALLLSAEVHPSGFSVPLCVPLPRDSFCRLLLMICVPCVEMEAGIPVCLRGHRSGEPGDQCLGGAWEALVVAARSGAVSVTPWLLLGALGLRSAPLRPPPPATEAQPRSAVTAHCLGECCRCAPGTCLPTEARPSQQLLARGQFC